MRGDLSDFLADAGAVVGGATVLGATLGFVAGSIVHDFWPDADPERWARIGGLFVGTGGLVVFLLVALPWIEMAPDGDLRRRTPR